MKWSSTLKQMILGESVAITCQNQAVEPTCALAASGTIVATRNLKTVSDLPDSERRGGSRWNEYKNCVASMDGRVVHIDDVSETGARVRCETKFPDGSTVTLELPWGKIVRADVLGTNGDIIRLKFQFPIEQPY